MAISSESICVTLWKYLCYTLKVFVLHFESICVMKLWQNFLLPPIRDHAYSRKECFPIRIICICICIVCVFVFVFVSVFVSCTHWQFLLLPIRDHVYSWEECFPKPHKDTDSQFLQSTLVHLSCYILIVIFFANTRNTHTRNTYIAQKNTNTRNTNRTRTLTASICNRP